MWFAILVTSAADAITVLPGEKLLIMSKVHKVVSGDTLRQFQ